MGAGIDHGSVEFLVTQKSLDGRDPAAGVQKLGRAGMAQAMRIDLHAHPFADGPKTRPDQILAERGIAVQEDMVAAALPAHG